ncbi:MAG: sugar efflux transporter for intercellular exchange family protein [Polaromonas sp.]|jgi:MtN3 and saliva related transmembrane protein|nr:sugar efflux transporter for intercellular exchange family protein [Polaromonas sp.]MDB5845206.1 sugar efflux transporter for intercellular exchange family protein [Polaromonas sp.]
MVISLTDAIGSAAAFLTTASFLPQAWLSFRTRDVSGVSLGMYSVFTTGVALWLAYGWLLGSWPMLIANTITLALSLAIVAMKLVYGRKPGRGRAAGRAPK